MSIFESIDSIDKQLQDLKKKPWFFAPSPELVQSGITVLTTIKERLEQSRETIEPDEIKKIILLIQQTCREKHLTSVLYCLRGIQFDFEMMDLAYTSSHPTTGQDNVSERFVLWKPPYSTKYLQYQSSESLIAAINEEMSYKLGNSKGMCLGLTYAMADPTLSPYKNPGLPIVINQDVFNYQKNQNDRKNDQKRIKRTRTTMLHFCPNPENRAKQCYAFAKQHPGKEFMLGLENLVGCNNHACYLSWQEDGIKYMDPNHGAYLFKKEEDFVSFYVEAANYDKAVGMSYHFYHLDELKVDDDLSLKESNTWMGMFRSLLTGKKYIDQGWIYQCLNLGMLICIALSFSMLFVPGMIHMNLLLFPIYISFKALSQGLNVLGIPYFLLDSFEHFKECLSKMKPSSTLSADKMIDLGLEPPMSSTAKMLSTIDATSESTPNNNTERLIEPSKPVPAPVLRVDLITPTGPNDYTERNRTFAV